MAFIIYLLILAGLVFFFLPFTLQPYCQFPGYDSTALHYLCLVLMHAPLPFELVKIIGLFF